MEHAALLRRGEPQHAARRRALGRRVCEEFGFIDALGRLQVAGCMKALARLAERAPEVELPPPRVGAVGRPPRQLAAAVPEPIGVPSHPAKIAGLTVTLVETASERALWNTLIRRRAVAARTATSQRWRVEDFFRVLKSGCRVEFLLFRTADRLQRAIAINAVIAWRIMVMTLLGREVPDCDPQLMFADHELDFLRDYALEQHLGAPTRLGDAVRLVAHLGGYRDRKHDPQPGHQIMWHGQTRLSSAALGHRIGFQAGKRHALTQTE